MDVEEETQSPFYYTAVTNIFENYGWYLLLFLILLYYGYSKAKPYIDSYLQKRNEEEYAARYHKNPDLVAARLAAQQEQALKLQEKYNKDAEEYQRKVEEREAKKKEEWLRKNENISTGTKLGRSDNNECSTSKSLKPEYNPLMGHTSRNYRPAKKSCGGGGCGK